MTIHIGCRRLVLALLAAVALRAAYTLGRTSEQVDALLGHAYRSGRGDRWP